MPICTPSKINLPELQLNLEILSIAPETATASADTLVFLHEGLGSVAMWRDWPEQLCQRLSCTGLVYSRQGYGQSDPVPNMRGPSGVTGGKRHGRLLPDYMHHEALVVLPALLQALHIERPVLIGHSDGGTIALIHTCQRPVAACVVMAPHVMVEDMSLFAITQARTAFETGHLRQKLSPYHADVEGAFWPWNDVWLSDAFKSFDIRPALRSLRTPLLAIQGEDDPYGTMAQIDEIAQWAPHTQRLKLPHCGHAPHRDQMEVVTHAIQQFVNRL